MTKRRYEPRSEKQQQATMVNFCLRSFAGLQRSLRMAGYYLSEQRVRELEEEFRHEAKRKEKK